MNKYAELMRRSAEEHKAAFAESDLTRELRAAADEIEKAEPVAALQDDTELKRRLEYKISACYFPGVNELELTWERISDGEIAAIIVPVTPEQGKAVSSVIGPCVYYSAVSKSVQTEDEHLRSTLTAALNWYEPQAQSAGDFTMVERMKKALGI